MKRKSKTKITKDILNIESIITKQFPELSKYIEEMPVQISYKVDDEISAENLKEYYNSLNELVQNYALSHKK